MNASVHPSAWERPSNTKLAFRKPDWADVMSSRTHMHWPEFERRRPLLWQFLAVSNSASLSSKERWTTGSQSRYVAICQVSLTSSRCQSCWRVTLEESRRWHVPWGRNHVTTNQPYVKSPASEFNKTVYAAAWKWLGVVLRDSIEFWNLIFSLLHLRL